MAAYMIDGKITKNFSLAEMANKQAKETTKLKLTAKMVEHAQMLQELRDWYGKSLEVSSWYRTKSFNESCGGSSDSAHLDGLATDINNIPESKYGEFKTAWEVICKNHGKIGGCNYYNWGMHFCSDEGRFGNKKFTVRDYRK